VPTSSTTTPSAPTSPPSPEPPPSSSNGYANPLRDVTALSAERIDQGVDYSGFGPIYAIGNGVVLTTVGDGWPSGTFIAYRLTDGPASGLVVFAAEDIQASVQVGETVTSGTVLGTVYAGPDGIETGWADGSALPNTMARTYGQFDGSNSSAFGYNFSELLQSLGAPGGIANSPPSGTLPPWWPRW
jgi:murein DD-endopeptidase MepM/ murein hydrolase activator NlpD